MCFSATASFTAGAVLTAAGVVVLKKAKNKKEIPFAMIPLLFGIQQLLEGVVWLSLYWHDAALNSLMSHFYFLFSNIWWPIFIPFVVMCVETIRWRKKVITVFELFGVAVASFFIYFMTINPIMGQVKNYCIVYNYPLHYLSIAVVLYVVAVCGSFFISSKKFFNFFGLLVLLSFYVAYSFYTEALVSVWCFFAAILSIAIYFYFARKRCRLT